MLKATLLFVAILLPPHTASAQWQKLQNLGASFDCGFAIDDQTILIGSGKGINVNDLENKTAQIYKSTDGGANWHLTKSTPSVGAVTSIFMQDATLGYATVFPFPNSSSTVLWKTTDGGETWTDLSQAIIGKPTCVYATSKAIVLSQWFDFGGSSTNGGNSFSSVLGTVDNSHTNGIDFTDDNTGVVTGLQVQDYPIPFYYTSDGGLTWNASTAERESWSVYGKKCTQQFFTANEDTVPKGNVIHWSSDGGRTWSPRFSFPDPKMRFTGTVAGRLNTLYVQTDIVSNEGIFRSDDLGLSWKSVGGPSDNRDTRFVVCGSHGEIVYAFDNQGGIWKTTNGGDGTLKGGPVSSSLLSITADSTVLVAHDCNPDTLNIDALNFGCVGVTIDSATIAPNLLGEFDLTITKSVLVPGDHSSLVIHFTPRNAPSHSAQVHVYAHSSLGGFDSVFSITGIDLNAIKPHFGGVIAANIGDTVDVPIYLTQTNDPFSISTFEAQYNFNGDLLTPIAIETRNTLAAGALSSFGASSNLNATVIDLTFAAPLTQAATDFSKPLFILKMRITLARDCSTPITLANFKVNGEAPLSLCSPSSVLFQALLRCGDRTVRSKLDNADIAKLLRVEPNPMSGAYEDVWYRLPSGGIVDLDLIDEQGSSAKTIIRSLLQSAGTYHIQFQSDHLTAGMYFLRLSVGGVSLSNYKVSESH